MTRPRYVEKPFNVYLDSTKPEDVWPSASRLHSNCPDEVWQGENAWLGITVFSGILEVHKGNAQEQLPRLISRGGFLFIHAAVLPEVTLIANQAGAADVRGVLVWTSDPTYFYQSQGAN